MEPETRGLEKYPVSDKFSASRLLLYGVWSTVFCLLFGYFYSKKVFGEKEGDIKTIRNNNITYTCGSRCVVSIDQLLSIKDLPSAVSAVIVDQPKKE